MEDGTIAVRCVCGWQTAGPEADVVAATVEHGQRKHNMTPTRDEVMAMAIPAGSTAPDPDPTPAPERAG